MKKSKIIKFIIILLIILLVIISFFIFELQQGDSTIEEDKTNSLEQNDTQNESVDDDNQNEIASNISENEEAVEVVYGKAERVVNATYFYTAQNCLELYLNNTEENDYSFVTITQMYQYFVQNNNVMRFVVHALFANQNKDTKYYNYIIYIDFKNLTYNVEKADDVINNLDSLNLNKKIDSIEKNGKNDFEYEVVTEEKLISKYLRCFKNMCLNAPSEAYNYLNNEYKGNNCRDVASFEKYIEQNINKIKNMDLNKYTFSTQNGKQRYICYDSQNNCYIINKNDIIMSFDIILDVNI